MARVFLGIAVVDGVDHLSIDASALNPYLFRAVPGGKLWIVIVSVAYDEVVEFACEASATVAQLKNPFFFERIPVRAVHGMI